MTFRASKPGMNWDSPIFAGNQVAVQQIWASHVKKENEVIAQGRKTSFGASLKEGTVAAKVGTLPNDDVDLDTADDDVKHATACALRSNRLPQEYLDEPMTAAQEVGWYAFEATAKRNHRFEHKLSLSPEAKFAEAYTLKHPGEFLYSGKSSGKFFKM